MQGGRDAGDRQCVEIRIGVVAQHVDVVERRVFVRGCDIVDRDRRHIGALIVTAVMPAMMAVMAVIIVMAMMVILAMMLVVVVAAMVIVAAMKIIVVATMVRLAEFAKVSHARHVSVSVNCLVF